MGTAILGGLIKAGYAVSVLPLMMSKGSTAFLLLAIPYFIFAAGLMSSVGITKRIFSFSNAVLGHVKGGLAYVNVLASMLFAGVSGASVADIAGLGTIEMEVMTKAGYDKDYSAAITLASSVVGPIIPPSIDFIIYSMLASVSVGRLFIAGIIPGILIGLLLMLTNYILIITGRMKVPKTRPFDGRKLNSTFKSSFLSLLAPLIMLLGMTTGIVTPTETGLIAVVYTFIVGVIYKELKLKNIIEVAMKSLQSVAQILFLIGVGSAIGWLVTRERIPEALTSTLLSLTDNKYIILFLINSGILLLGTVLDGISIKLILVPLLLPIMDILGIDRLQFGVFLTINTLIGFTTPPVGVGLFVTSSVTGLPIHKIVKAVLPYYLPLLLALLLTTYVPIITTWLPKVLLP